MNFSIADKKAWAAWRFQALYERVAGISSAPPEARTGNGRLLWRTPPPLIDPTHKTIVIFSAKAACTNVLVWFFHHLGHLQAAQDFNHWPHEYRTRVYYFSDLYRKAYNLDLSRFAVIRVVRDPFDRAASSYRHLLRHALDRLGTQTRMRHVGRTGLSFSEFLDFLGRLDLSDCDPHFIWQRHPIEDVLPVRYLINVSKDDLFTRFTEIEGELGLPTSDLRAHPWVERLSRRHRPENELEADGPLYMRRLKPANARFGPWPKPADLLTPEARVRIAQLYAPDIKAYFADAGATAAAQVTSRS